MNEQRGLLSGYLDMYRRLVNPELLYVNVSFAGKSCGYVLSFSFTFFNSMCLTDKVLLGCPH